MAKTDKECGDCKWFIQVVGAEVGSPQGRCVRYPRWEDKLIDTQACGEFKKE